MPSGRRTDACRARLEADPVEIDHAAASRRFHEGCAEPLGKSRRCGDIGQQPVDGGIREQCRQ
jgi:hypothetical protein